jgi:hypothetical protein
MASYIGRAPRGARSRREAANQPMRGLVTAISYAVGTIGMLLWGAPPTDSTSVAGTSAWRVPSPRSAAGAILRIELRSSRHFRFESRRRWAASEKVWIVEETFDCVGKRAGSHTPAVPTGLRY